MGAYFNSISFSVCAEPELRTLFQSHQAECRYEGGNDGYAGHMGVANGLSVSEQTFTNSVEAEEWLSDHAKKWGPAIAVKVGNFALAFPMTQMEKKLDQNYKAISAQLDTWEAGLVAQAKSAKSLLRTCSACESKIAVKYLRTSSCPVCLSSKFLTTVTSDQKLSALQIKHKTLSAQIQKAKEKYATNTAHWLVGALCAS